MMLAVGFSKMSFIRLRKFPSLPVSVVASQNLVAKNNHLLCSQILWVRNLDKELYGKLVLASQRLSGASAGRLEVEGWNHLKACSLIHLVVDASCRLVASPYTLT